MPPDDESPGPAGFWTDRVELAARLAAVGHRGQVRRGSGVPYVAHPFAVATILDRAGLGDDAVIVGLLHDLVEDTDVSPDQIRRDFGDAVADAVLACSEVKADDRGRARPWEDRKRDHVAAIASAGPIPRAVTLADKLHNLLSIEHDLARGVPVWESFHAGPDRVLWYYRAIIDACDGPPDRAPWPGSALASAAREALGRIASAREKIADRADPTA